MRSPEHFCVFVVFLNLFSNASSEQQWALIVLLQCCWFRSFRVRTPFRTVCSSCVEIIQIINDSERVLVRVVIWCVTKMKNQYMELAQWCKKRMNAFDSARFAVCVCVCVWKLRVRSEWVCDKGFSSSNLLHNEDFKSMGEPIICDRGKHFVMPIHARL